MNLVVLQGNLTREVEFKNIGSTNVANFGLAINRKTKNGEETTFVEVTAFGRTAENIAKYFTKGRMIVVQGRLHLDQWKDTNTQQQRTKLKVVAERFFFCGSSGGQQQGQYQGQQQAAPQGSQGYASNNNPANQNTNYQQQKQAPASPFVGGP